MKPISLRDESLPFEYYNIHSKVRTIFFPISSDVYQMFLIQKVVFVKADDISSTVRDEFRKVYHLTTDEYPVLREMVRWLYLFMNSDIMRFFFKKIGQEINMLYFECVHPVSR